MSEQNVSFGRIAPARPLISWRLLAPIVALLEFALIVVLTIAIGTGYSIFAFGHPVGSANQLALGVVVGGLFVAVSHLHHRFDYAAYATRPPELGVIWGAWNLAFLILFAVIFLLKVGPDFSRATAGLLYLFGLAALWLHRRVIGEFIRDAGKTGRLSARRVCLVGRRSDVEEFGHNYQPWNDGLTVVGAVLIPNNADADEAFRTIDKAIDETRANNPDDIVLIAPWANIDLINRAVDAFKAVPASILLAPEAILERYEAAQIIKTGRMTGLMLMRAPLSSWEQIAKRSLDIVIASLALLILSPILLLVALAIRVESKGPAIFRQWRHGFNNDAFRIYKFRTMTVMEDGSQFSQARQNDSRLTRIGRVLRRTNIDELPQLINVLRGEMSIVGPRPHALSHNAEFQHKIALYARRHNVKPGITGWAQVHGHRGPTDTDEKMRQRLEHDLYYLDNWSLLLDLEIIIRTFFSRSAFRNAH